MMAFLVVARNTEIEVVALGAVESHLDHVLLAFVTGVQKTVSW